MDWKAMPDSREKYAAYLASREWAVLKEAVKARSGGTCERCEWNEATQTHHQTYTRKYREELTDLLHVCAPCHEFVSGKRADDPILKRPLLFGRHRTPLQSIYLAGKITGTTWRTDIITGWSLENHGFGVNYRYEWGKNGFIARNRIINYAGPYWRAIDDCGGHSWSGDNSGSHAYGVPSATGSEAEESPNFSTDYGPLFLQLVSSINRADLIFAWIDAPDCHGTIAEIGLAYGLHKPIAIYFPPSQAAYLQREQWLPLMMSRFGGIVETPKAAWEHFLENHTR
ncbi:MAG: hypothetical protein QM811_06860 [Pirellulales bacterium]